MYAITTHIIANGKVTPAKNPPNSSGIIKNRFDGVKILSNGDVTKKFTVKADAYSGAAKEKIEAAGGKAEVI